MFLKNKCIRSRKKIDILLDQIMDILLDILLDQNLTAFRDKSRRSVKFESALRANVFAIARVSIYC